MENYYVQPAGTQTRASLMTGMYPAHLGLQHDVLYPGQPAGLPLHFRTLANELKDRGTTATQFAHFPHFF